MAGESATAEDVAYIRELYGFDRPFLVRYFAWASRAVTGDFGYSYYLRTDVSSIIFAHLPVTMTLGACALGFALLLARSDERRVGKEWVSQCRSRGPPYT